MKRTLVIAIPALAIMLSMIPLHGKPQEQTGKASKAQLDSFMEMKLEHAKAILEGLSTEDFEQIAKASQALTALSLESSWNAHTTEKYLDHSSDFRRALNLVTSAAREENLDRAALGYLNMTVQCIECHRYLRDKHSGDEVKK